MAWSPAPKLGGAAAWVNGEARVSERSNSPPDRRRHNALQPLRALLVPKDGKHHAIGEDHIRSVLASRRGREAAFGRELFCDPAWDMLLELYAAHLAGRAMTLADLVLSIDLPQSTIGRWANAIAARGLLAFRGGEDSEARVELTAKGEESMERLMNHWGSAFRSI
jgi:DNA-binding MarR family transcriptional regulator